MLAPFLNDGLFDRCGNFSDRNKLAVFLGPLCDLFFDLDECILGILRRFVAAKNSIQEIADLLFDLFNDARDNLDGPARDIFCGTDDASLLFAIMGNLAAFVTGCIEKIGDRVEQRRLCDFTRSLNAVFADLCLVDKSLDRFG